MYIWKCTIQWFSAYLQCYTTFTTECFHHLKKKFCTFKQSLPILASSQPLEIFPSASCPLSFYNIHSTAKQLRQCIACILKTWDYKRNDFSSLGKQIPMWRPVLQLVGWRCHRPLAYGPSKRDKSNFPQAGKAVITMELQTCHLECLKTFSFPQVVLLWALVHSKLLSQSFKQLLFRSCWLGTSFHFG